jgi:hypothetical protein
MTPTRRRARDLGAAAVLTAVTAAAVTSPALAAGPTGQTTIDLKGPAAKALRSQQVKLSARKPAKAGPKRIVLPLGGASVSKSAAKLTHRGSVTLRRKTAGRTRAVTLTAWQTQVTGKRTTISAKLGGKRIALFTVTAAKSRVKLTPASGASLTGGTVRLSPAGAKALRAKLALTRLPAAQVGAAKVVAKLPARSGGGTTAPTPGGGTTTPPPTRQCQGFDSSQTPTASDPLARPASASGVASAPMAWYARDSWIRYMNTPDNGVRVADGATLGPVENYPDPTDSYRDPRLSPRFAYSVNFQFDPAGSWYDATTNTGRFTYKGSVRFLWETHYIDLTFKDPEVELNGAASRLVFTVIGAACSNVPAKRVELFSLASQAPTGTAPYAFPSLRSTISAGGAALFAGQYFAGNEWGSVKQLAVTLAP